MLPVDILKLRREHRYLSNTDEFAKGTPSNRIIFKTLPNIGATHGEILLYDWRNSICLLPNVPVLYGKRDSKGTDGLLMYPNILIVCKGITKAQVDNYLASEISPKKILCTPEAYIDKVAPAIRQSKFDLYRDFFMLMDECDKLIRDVDYRPKIILPIVDFFKFKNKAMISATAVEPSDSRFAEHNFRILKVEPQYNYSNNLNLITTNNTLGALRMVMSKDPLQSYFIFINSTDLIHSIIKALNIDHDSQVFCAERSVRKLAKEGFMKASDRLIEFKKYNFLTSRFFSAVDIKLNTKPNVVMITNVDRAQFSMLDPNTDCIQIVGRLRNGVGKVIHITNTNSNIQTFDENELLRDINDSYNEYAELAKRKDFVATKAGIKTLKQALDGTDISLLVNDEGVLNSYMVDNVIIDNKVKKLYQHQDSLIAAYNNLANFKLKLHNLVFDITDQHLLAIEQKKNSRTLCEHVATILDVHYNPMSNDGTLRFYLGQDIGALRSEHEEIVRQYDEIGFDMMKSLGFYRHRINIYISSNKKKDELNGLKLREDMHLLYKIPTTILEATLKADGQRVFTKHRISKLFRPADILRYFYARRTTDNQRVKCWKLTGVK